jgi:hypothetical protein
LPAAGPHDAGQATARMGSRPGTAAFPVSES